MDDSFFYREYDEKTDTEYLYEYKETVDKETGEIQRKRYTREIHYGQKPFVRVDKKLFYAVTKDLSKNALVLANFLMMEMDHKTNKCFMTGKQISGIMNIRQNAFDKAMQELQAADIVRNCQHGVWMVNPTLVFATYEKLRESFVDMYRGYPSYQQKQAKAEKEKENANVDIERCEQG